MCFTRTENLNHQAQGSKHTAQGYKKLRHKDLNTRLVSKGPRGKGHILLREVLPSTVFLWLQCLLEVSDNIFRGFDAYRHADERVGDSQPAPLFRG
jgi:hypothetical protein